MATSLTNCYIPLPATGSNNTEHKSVNRTSKNSHELRRVSVDRSILSKSKGSSLLELGQTKILCAVHGPRPLPTSFLKSAKQDFFKEGILNCEIRHAPNFGIRPATTASTAVRSLDDRGYERGGGGSTMMSAEEMEMSGRLRDAIAPSIPLDKFPKCVLDVYVMVLQADGSILPAAIMASSLALADAAVEMYDMVSSCSVAVMESDEEAKKNGVGLGFSCLTDPTEEEMRNAVSVVTISMLPNWKEVTYWDQTGKHLPPSIASDALELCRDGCVSMHKFMRKCLLENKDNDDTPEEMIIEK